MDLALVVAVKEIPQREFGPGGGHLGFEEVKIVVGVPVDDGDTHVIVGVVGVGGLVDGRGARGDNVGGVEAGVERVGLASVDHEKHFIIAVAFWHRVSEKAALIGLNGGSVYAFGRPRADYRFFSHICSKASARSQLPISSLS